MSDKAIMHSFEFAGVSFELKYWGVFVVEGAGQHVAPCDAEGNLDPEHELTWQCPCLPEWEDGICAHNRFHVEH